jgi:hypothetical protein
VDLSDPVHSTSFTFNADGTFSYTPDPGFNPGDGTAQKQVCPLTIVKQALASFEVLVTVKSQTGAFRLELVEITRR